MTIEQIDTSKVMIILGNNDMKDFDDFLQYANDEQNKKRFHLLNYSEKELLYYFSKISSVDKREIIEFTKIKARKELKD